MSKFEIRAHHGLCTYFFEGKGYSDDFSHNMTEVIEKLAQNPTVKIVSHGDLICSHCPNLTDGICKTPEKVNKYDRRVMELCQIKDGCSLLWQEFSSMVKEKIIDTGKIKTVCSDCQWSEICHHK